MSPLPSLVAHYKSPIPSAIAPGTKRRALRTVGSNRSILQHPNKNNKKNENEGRTNEQTSQRTNLPRPRPPTPTASSTGQRPHAPKSHVSTNRPTISRGTIPSRAPVLDLVRSRCGPEK